MVGLFALCLDRATSLFYPPFHGLSVASWLFRPRGFCVSDIFHEVDEEVRREQLKKLWERYGVLFVVLAVVVVLGVAGWRGYDWWITKESAKAGAAFEAAATLAEQGKTDDALTAFQRVAAEGTAGYAKLARFREAGELAKRDPKAAVALYEGLAADSKLDKSLQELAAIRAGFLLADSASAEELRRRLEPLAAPDGVFRHTAREILALSAWKNGDAAGLKRWSDLIVGDAETPAAIRSRVEVLNTLAIADRKS
jgi:hypothetical protein